MTTPTLLWFLNANNLQTVVSGSNLNALASNASVLGSSFSNVQADGAGLGMVNAWAWLHLDSMAVAAGGSFQLWFLPSYDGGTTYSQGGTSVTPLSRPSIIWVPVVQTAAIDIIIPCQVPNAANIKSLLKNSATGASTPSNTNGYVKLAYNAPQIVSI